jgi:hypothetical protein
VQRGTDREELLGKIQEAAKVNYAAMYEGYEVQLENSMQLIRYDELTNSHSHTLTNINPFVFRIILIDGHILIKGRIKVHLLFITCLFLNATEEFCPVRTVGPVRVIIDVCIDKEY